MDTLPTTNESQAKDAALKNWCNFCGYTTDDLDDYLKHSCVDVIKETSQTVVPSIGNACA